MGPGRFVSEMKISDIMPCLADPDKIRFVAYIEKDISPPFPYLNAILKSARYNHAGRTLTLKMEGRLISLRPRMIGDGKIIDENNPLGVMEWIKEKTDCCQADMNSIKPSCERRQRLTALDLFKRLPDTNGRKCGQLTCLALAVELAEERLTAMKCRDIFSSKYEEKGKELFCVRWDRLKGGQNGNPNLGARLSPLRRGRKKNDQRFGGIECRGRRPEGDGHQQVR